MKRFFPVFIFLVSTVAALAAPAPTLFFTDLQYAPVGAIVTVYGSNLSSTVQVNGVSASVVATGKSHSGFLQTVSFTVPNTSSGNITMTGGNNSLPLTIQPMNVYWVATTGNDSNSGTQSSPWATLPHAIHTAGCNSIIYAMNGVSQTGVDNYNASIAVNTACTQATPLALVGYPGATVTVGSATGAEYGIRSPDLSTNDWNGIVFANLVVRGNNTAFNFTGDQYWRIVDTDDSCPTGSGEAACILIDASSNVEILGNYVHDTGAGGTKYYHSIYGTTNTINAEVAWNYIYNNQSCRGVQFYSTSGSPQYNLSVHDNIIDGQLCDGINFSTVDATQGYIKAYNNLIFNVGNGNPNTLGTPNMACIASLGYGNPGGTAYFYGNTMANCGSGGGSTAGAITVQSGSPTVDLDSNLVIQNPGEVIYSPNNDSALVVPSSNVLLTTGTAGVVNSSYQPISGSPAIGAGVALSGILFDLAGNPRAQSGSEDAGAYLYSSSSGSSGGPTATLSPTTLSFGNQTVNSSSSPQTVTLSNSGVAALSITSIGLSGTNANQFSSSNTCGSSVPAGQNCTIQAQFNPTSAGSMTAGITINSNASNPAESISLSGVGTAAAAAAVTLAPTSISFGNQVVNTTSNAQTVTVTNSGTAALNLSGVALTGSNSSAFQLSNGCGATLAAGASCALHVAFAPTASGSMSAAVTLTDSAANSPQSVALSGTGTSAAPSNPSVTLSPTSLTFPSVATGGTSSAQTVTLTNSGSGPLSITSIAASGDFAESNKCGSSVAGGASCSIAVTFTPTATGTRSGTLSITDGATGSPQTVALSGMGTSISVTSTSASLTLKSKGGSTKDGIMLQAVDGFSGTVDLVCAVVAQGNSNSANLPTCSLSPSSAQLASGAPSEASTLTVNSASGNQASRADKWLHGGAVAALLLFVLVPRRNKRWWSICVLLGTILIGTTLGCGGVTYNPLAVGNRPGSGGNYKVTVTATSGTVSAAVSVPLVMQ